MKRKRLTKGSPMPEQFHQEVRKIRKGYLVLEASNFSCSESSGSVVFECSRCGELGDHLCLPELFEAIEQMENLRVGCWNAYKHMTEGDEGDE